MSMVDAALDCLEALYDYERDFTQPTPADTEIDQNEPLTSLRYSQDFSLSALVWALETYAVRHVDRKPMPEPVIEDMVTSAAITRAGNALDAYLCATLPDDRSRIDEFNVVLGALYQAK